MEITKILSYDLYGTTTGIEKYHRVCALLRKQFDPSSLQVQQLDCARQAVFMSPRRRAFSCIDNTTYTSIDTKRELDELGFRFEDFCSADTYAERGSIAVREAFVEAFVSNSLDVTLETLRQELQTILAWAKQEQPPLCVSHTFRMKVLSLYSEVGEVLFNNPSMIRSLIDCRQHLFPFGATITV